MVGKWVIASRGEYYNTGRVVEVVGESFILVEVKSSNGPPVRLQLFCLGELIEDPLSMFFDTKKQLDAYMAWVDTASEPELRVVPVAKEG